MSSYSNNNDLEAVESHNWLKNQIWLTRKIRPLNDSVYSPIRCENDISSSGGGGAAAGRKGNAKNVRVITDVRHVACIPFPADDKSAFLSDAISFSDWVGYRPEAPEDTAPHFFKRLFLSVLMAVQQRDLGTKNYRKGELMKKDTWAQF